MTLQEEIKSFLDPSLCQSDDVYKAIVKRIDEGKLIRDENQLSHFCTHFLPYNPTTHEIFLVHHKKAGTWIAPGGHIEKNESLIQTLNREINEELGQKDFFKVSPKPFLITIKEIENPNQTCKVHYDIWFLAPTEVKNFKVDPEEFYDSTWIKIENSDSLLKDPNNLAAVERIIKSTGN